MLLLTRKQGEKISLRLPGGSEIVIAVNEVNPGRTSIGITAGDDIKILRKELTHDV